MALLTGTNGFLCATVRAVAAHGPARSAITARKDSLSGLPSEFVRMRGASRLGISGLRWGRLRRWRAGDYYRRARTVLLATGLAACTDAWWSGGGRSFEPSTSDQQ